MANLIGRLTFEIDANTQNITDSMKDTIQSITAMDTRLQRSLQGIIKLTGDYKQSFKSALERWEGVGVSTFTDRHKQGIVKLGADIDDAISKGDWDTAIKRALNYREVLIRTKAPIDMLVAAQTNLNNITLQAASAQQKLEDRNGALGVALRYAAEQNVRFNTTLAESLAKTKNYADAFSLLKNAVRNARLPDIDPATGARRVDARGAPAFIETDTSRQAMESLVKLQREYAAQQAIIAMGESAVLLSMRDKKGATEKLVQALQLENMHYSVREKLIQQLEATNKSAAAAQKKAHREHITSIYDEIQALKQRGSYLDAKALSERYLLDFEAIRKRSAVEKDLIEINKVLFIEQLKSTAATKDAATAIALYKSQIAGLNLSKKQASEVNRELAVSIIESTKAQAANLASSANYAKAATLMQDVQSQLRNENIFDSIGKALSDNFQNTLQTYASKAADQVAKNLVKEANRALYVTEGAFKEGAVLASISKINSMYGIDNNLPATAEYFKLSDSMKDRLLDIYNSLQQAYETVHRSRGEALAKQTLRDARDFIAAGQPTQGVDILNSKLKELKALLGENSKEFQSFSNRAANLGKVFFAKDFQDVSELFENFRTEAKIEFDLGNFDEAVSILRDFDKIRQQYEPIFTQFDEKMLQQFNKALSQAETSRAIQQIQRLGEGPEVDVANLQRITEIQNELAKTPGILAKDLDKVNAEARKVYTTILNANKEVHDDIRAVAIRTAESFKLDGDLQSAIGVLRSLEDHFISAFGKAAHQTIAVSNEIKKLENQLQTLKTSEVEKNLSTTLDTAKRLAAEAAITTNEIAASEKYAEALAMVEKALEGVTQYSKKAADAQDFLTKTARAAADKAAQFTIESYREMANAGDVKGALQALREFRDQVQKASESADSLTFEIENLSKASKRTQADIAVVNNALDELKSSGDTSSTTFKSLTMQQQLLQGKLEATERSLRNYRTQLASIDRAHIVSQKTVKQLGAEITTMTKRASSVWRRFNLDGAQLTQAFIGASIGAYSLYDGIQNAAQMLKEFAIQSIATANEMQRVSYSASLVSKDLATFTKISRIAEDNQRLFGGTLTENIKELTGFTLVARTAGVDLESLVSTSQRLAAFDPGQGIQGASISLREFLAGNIRSLRERFELPANILKDLGDASLTAQQKLDKLSNFLDEQGLSAANIRGQLLLTQQTYRDFGIEWEKTTKAAGSIFAETFKGVVQTGTATLKVLNMMLMNSQARAEASMGYITNFIKQIPILGLGAQINDLAVSIRYVSLGINPDQLKADIQRILRQVPEAEIKIQAAIGTLNFDKDVEKFKNTIEGLKRQAEEFENIDLYTDEIAQFAEDTAYVENMQDFNGALEDVGNQSPALAEAAFKLKEISLKSDRAALAASKLLREFKKGDMIIDEFIARVKKLDEETDKLTTTERFAAEAQKRRDEGLQSYTESYAKLIALIKELNGLNYETGPMVTQGESGVLLAYVQSEIEKAREAEVKDLFIDLINQAADALIEGGQPTLENINLLAGLTGATPDDLQGIINAWVGVRTVQIEAARANFDYSRSAIEAESASAELAAGAYLAENAFKEYQRTGIITDKVMAQLLEITDETGKKIYENEGAVYGAADAYVYWQNVLSKTGQGLNQLSLESINLQIAEVNRQIAQERGAAAFEEYAKTQKIAADDMRYLMQLTDENGVKIYENEQAVYDAADAYKVLINRKEELEGLQSDIIEGTDGVTSATNDATDAQKRYTGQTLLARIQAEKQNATNNIAEEILNGLADGAVLTANKQAFLQNALKGTGTSVSRLITLWEELIMAQTFGSLIDTDPMILQLRRAGARLADIKKYIAETYGLENFFGLGGDEGGGGGGGGEDTINTAEEFFEKMKEIADDYRDEVLEAEREFQKELLDIQEEFQEKQLKSLKESEVDKRRTRVSFYRGLIDSDLPHNLQQEFSAKFETIWSKAMEAMSAGNIELGKGILKLGTEQIERDMQYESDIAQAIEDGNLERADVLRKLQKMDQDIYDFEMRTLLEEGDPNVKERDAAILEANDKMSESLDEINVKAGERARALLESEPEIAKNLAATNEEYAEMLGFITDLSNYVSPLQKGLNDATLATDALFSKTRDFVNFVKNNPIGRAFTSGIAQGVEEGTPDVVNAVDDTGNQMVDHAKNTLEAKSPSKRTAREIGVPFAQGIVRGIVSYAKNIQSATKGLITGAVGAARNAFAELPPGIVKSQENIDAFKDFANTNIDILEGLRALLPDTGGAAEGRATYVAEMARIDQDTEAQITARREKLSRDVLLARTDDERRILEAIAQQDIALLQQQANIQKASQEEQIRNVVDQEAIDAKMSEIQQNAAMRLEALQERMKELAKTNPEEAARIYQIRAQQILEVANLRQELERYLLENNLTSDDAFASLLRQQIQQVQALGQMEIQGVNVGNAPINNTVYNISMDLTGSSLRREEVRTIVRQELSRALANSRGSTA